MRLRRDGWISNRGWCPQGHADRMPVSYFCNGHLLIDSEKMSKSTGNFMTLSGQCDVERLIGDANGCRRFDQSLLC